MAAVHGNFTALGVMHLMNAVNFADLVTRSWTAVKLQLLQAMYLVNTANAGSTDCEHAKMVLFGD